MRIADGLRRDFAASVIASLLTVAAGPPASATSKPARWSAELPLYLTATAHYRNVDSAHDWRSVASILGELRLRYGDRAWSIGPVVEIHRTVNGRDDTAVGSGVIFRQGHGRWDTTALVYRHMPRHAPGSWNYGARLRYRTSPAGKLGAEAYGAVDAMGSSRLWFGYYGDVTRTLSFRLLAGTNVDDRDVRLMRLDVVLQVN